MQAGVAVTFTNHGGAAHSVTFSDLDVDMTIPAGGSATHVFTQPGTYEYVCKFHPPDMRGTIVVQEA